MSWSGTVTCSHCYGQGHNKRACPQLTDSIERQYYANCTNAEQMREQGNENDAKWYEQRAEEKRQEYIKRTKFDLATGERVTNKRAKAERMKKVRCGYCTELGHTRRVCPWVKIDKQVFIEQTRRTRIAAFDDAANMGIGVGSMIPIRASGYDSNGEWRMHTQLRYIQSVDWDACDSNRPNLLVRHTDARKLGSAAQARHTARDTIDNLKKAFHEAREHAITEEQKPPMASLIPDLEAPAGWLEPTEKSIEENLRREFPTTGNQYDKQRNYCYRWPEGMGKEVIKDLGLSEHYPNVK